VKPAEREYLAAIVLAAIVGVLGAVGNVVFRAVIAGAAWLFRSHAEGLGRWGIVPALLAGGVVLLALDRIFPGEVLGYGFPRFLELLHLHGALVKRRWILVKTLGAGISLGAGAAVGREGPIAQIGGAIGAAVARLARFPTEQRKILVACGVAAGIATTFNAPLGALMFAHEIVLLGELHLANFSLIVIATTAAVVASRGLFANEAVFHVTPFVIESYWECVTYAVLGIVLGLLAVAYMRLFHSVARRARALPWPRPVVLLGGLALVGLLDVAVPRNISDGYPIVNEALAGSIPWPAMAALGLAKIAGSAVSLGCGAPGGVFGPIFFIGAMTGGAFRGLSALVFPHLTGPRGSYALVGLGAFLAATTHAPLTAIFLLFEMTQNYSVTVPALIAAGVALMVATRLEPESIDTLGLTAEGKSLHPSSERAMLEQLPIGDAYRRDVDAIPEAASFAEILGIVGGSRSGTFPVVDAGGALRGVLSSIALRTILLEHDLDRVVIAADLADPNVPTLTPEDTLGAAFRLMEAEGLDDVPVVDPADRRRLLGMLSRGDLLAAYNRAVATIGALGTWLTTGGARRTERFRVAVLPVPPAWVGRSLREVDVRARYSVTVLAVERNGRGDGAYELPDPDRPLAATDRLVVAGTDDALRRAGAA
jgi:CIC family chloride channel protein